MPLTILNLRIVKCMLTDIASHFIPPDTIVSCTVVTLVASCLSCHELLHHACMFSQMQLPVGEDLLQNIENFAVAVGEVLSAAITNNATDNTSRTIERQNFGICYKC